MHITKDLVAASATPLVLGILAEDESYGYAILKQISERSEGRLEWTEGLLYPLLHRLERLGYVESAWRSSVRRPQAQVLPNHRPGPVRARRAAAAMGRRRRCVAGCLEGIAFTRSDRGAGAGGMSDDR